MVWLRYFVVFLMIVSLFVILKNQNLLNVKSKKFWIILLGLIVITIAIIFFITTFILTDEKK